MSPTSIGTSLYPQEYFRGTHSTHLAFESGWLSSSAFRVMKFFRGIENGWAAFPACRYGASDGCHGFGGLEKPDTRCVEIFIYQIETGSALSCCRRCRRQLWFGSFGLAALTHQVWQHQLHSSMLQTATNRCIS